MPANMPVPLSSPTTPRPRPFPPVRRSPQPPPNKRPARTQPRYSLRARGFFLTPGLGCLLIEFTPCTFVLLLVVAEGFDQAPKHLGRGLKHGLEPGFIDLLDVFPQVSNRFVEPLFHFLRVVPRIAVGRDCHGEK